MGKKKREGDSSLELLLDTMCNTFGGVMFIAIALVVIMAMLGKVEKQLDSEAERAELQKKIEELKQELKRTQERTSELELLHNRLKNDPRREWIAQLLQQETQLSQERILLQATQSERNLAEQSALAQEKKLLEATRRQAILKQEQAARIAEQEKLNREWEIVRSESKNTPSVAITFRLIERSEIAPFYLIVDQNRIYRIGPETMRGPNAMTPHTDCLFVTGITQGRRMYTCKPNPEKGTPILENGTISSGAIALLNEIPQDRAPLFFLDKASLGSFCLLREYLKNAKIRHGADPTYETNRCVSYFITDKAEYEY